MSVQLARASVTGRPAARLSMSTPPPTPSSVATPAELVVETGDVHIDEEAPENPTLASIESEALAGITQATHRKMTQQAKAMAQLKIIVGFFQITSQLAANIDVSWPPTYRAFIGIFTFVNLDIWAMSNPSCVARVSYYDSWIFMMVLPWVVLLAFALFFLLPWYIKIHGNSSECREIRDKRFSYYWAMFTKLYLFVLFLLYPRVSAASLRMYACHRVEGVDYLVADFNIKCQQGDWNTYAMVNIFFVFLYPVGIPVLYFALLYRIRNRSFELPARYRLGFIYESYNTNLWWFEVMDQAHKLCLTSLIMLLPRDIQLPVGMVACMAYLIVILIAEPYYRKPDDMLHCFAQVEIFLFMLAGTIMIESESVSGVTDVGLSVFLIVALACFLFVFIRQVLGVIKVMWNKFLNFTGLRSSKGQDVPTSPNDARQHRSSSVRFRRMGSIDLLGEFRDAASPVPHSPAELSAESAPKPALAPAADESPAGDVSATGSEIHLASERPPAASTD